MVLKEDKITIFGIISIVCLLVLVPTISATIDLSVGEICASVMLAQISFGVVLTSKVIPILTEKYAKKRSITKNSIIM